MDQSKKTMRHFYCRDVLWETFEQMANDFDCSIDYLINESMRYYARSKNYQSARSTGSDFRGGTGSGSAPVGLAPPGPGTQAPFPPSPSGGMPVSPAAEGSPGSHGGRRTGPPPPPSPRAPMAAPTGAPTLSGSGAAEGVQDAGATASTPRRPAPPAPRPVPESSPGPTLFLVYNNQRITIDKDQFIIGRGSKTSDLAIKDGNISRKHAAVIRRNGTYYIKDLGSTNGIDYKGMRIDNKRIDEGDIFLLCDYELRFTYRSV
jgi:hypothetical protein